MTKEKTFDRADLLRFFYETERDALAGSITVIHPPTPQQLAFDQEATQGETRRYPVLAETTGLYCERYGFSVIFQELVWPDGGDQYLPKDDPLRALSRERRVITRYGGTSSQLVRWAAELADIWREEVTTRLPAAAIDILARRNAAAASPLPEPPAAAPEPEPDPQPPAGETLDDFLSGLDITGLDTGLDSGSDTGEQEG